MESVCEWVVFGEDKQDVVIAYFPDELKAYEHAEKLTRLALECSVDPIYEEEIQVEAAR